MHPLKQKFLTGSLALCFALSSVFSPVMVAAVSNIQSAPSPSSIYGYDHYETAAKMAQNGWKVSSDYAILAAGMPTNLIDALAAGPLAATLNSPILLSEGSGLNKHAKEELTRLKVKKVYVTSGSAVIKQRVIDEVKTIASVTEVKTLGGYDASHTSVNIAKEMESLGVKVSKVVVTGGAGSDALSIAPIAGAQGMPILYTDRDSLSNYVFAYLDGIKANLTKTYIIGGTGVISDAAQAQLPGSVARYYGQTLYDTNLEVLKQFAGVLKNQNTYVANGDTLVDALAGVPLAVQSNSPILLTSKTMTTASLKYAQSNLSPNVIALGGESVVPSKVLTQLGPSEIISLDGSSKGSADATNLEQFNGIIKVTGNNVTLKNAKTEYSIYVQGDNATLTNLTVHGTIFLDPGDKGSATLQNVNATNIVILSGAEHSINLMNVIAALLSVQSNSPNVHVNASEATRFEQTQASSSAIFEAADGSFFGTIRITYSSQESGAVPVVELIGTFPDTIEVGGGVTVIAAPGSNISNLAITTVNPSQTVTLQGNFNSVAVNSQANVTLGANTTITNVVANAVANIVVPLSSSITNFDSGGTGTTPTGGGSVGGTPITTGGNGNGSGSGTVQVNAISVSPTTMTLTAGGAIGTVIPTITPANATSKNVNWTSSNEIVATVANGIVTPKTAGTTSIVVTTIDGDKTANCIVTVVPTQPQTEVDLEIIIADEQEIWVTVCDKTSDEAILGLTKENFSLLDASGNDLEFKFNDPGVRDPAIPDHEYLLSPVEGSFTGTNTLTFSKVGYQSISEDFTISINEEQAAPTGLAGVAPTAALNDGQITGTTIAMEYKLAAGDDSTYASCSAMETTVAAAGEYVVRLAAKSGFNAGATAAVTVPAYVIPITPPVGDLLDANAGSDFTGVLYTRGGNIYFNQADISGTYGNEALIGSGTEGRMAVDSSGNSHVVYTTSGKIGYSMYDGSVWSEEVLIESENIGGAGSCSKPDVAVDGAGKAHITYTDSHGSTGDNYTHPDIMYATNAAGDFNKTLIYTGYRDYSSSGYWGADYFNKGSFITVNSNGDYYILSHKQNIWRWPNGTDNTYSVVVKSNLGIGSTTTSASAIFDIYDLTSNGDKVSALYKQTGFKTSELIVSGGTINFTNTCDITATSVSSIKTAGSNTVVGGKSNTNLQTVYNGTSQVYEGIVVKDTKVAVVNLDGTFYAVYTDNSDNIIKRTEIEGFTVIESAVIETAAIAGVTAPVNGSTPVSTIADTSEYTATITITPKSG